jgi:hypothetical protein
LSFFDSLLLARNGPEFNIAERAVTKGYFKRGNNESFVNEILKYPPPDRSLLLRMCSFVSSLFPDCRHFREFHHVVGDPRRLDSELQNNISGYGDKTGDVVREECRSREVVRKEYREAGEESDKEAHDASCDGCPWLTPALIWQIVTRYALVFETIVKADICEANYAPESNVIS